MIRILFVCLGNICRSPMAEFVMKDIAAEKGLSDVFEIGSAATSSEEIGNPVYPPARRELAAHGISCEGKRARRLTAADYEKYDHIIGMEESNIRGILRIFGGDPDGKVCRLMDFTGRDEDIRDPWYTGDFSGVYDQIREGCEAFIAKILPAKT